MINCEFMVYVQNILFFLLGSNPPATQLILHNQLALAYLEAQ